MKRRAGKLAGVFVAWVCLFALQKPLFMCYYRELYASDGWRDWLAVMWHGLPLDLAMAGYLSVVPGLVLSVSCLVLRPWLQTVLRLYFVAVCALLAVIMVADMGLYEFWRFRLDATPVFYLFSSPKDALASVSAGYLLLGATAIILTFLVLYGAFFGLVAGRRAFFGMKLPPRLWLSSGTLLLLTSLLFVPIRGGFSVSTMNTGKVFYSSEMRLNHAALNPAFNLMESLSKQKDFSRQYRLLPEEEAREAFGKMLDPQVAHAQPAAVEKLFKEEKPNVLIVILEGFSSKLMATLGGEPHVAVHLDSLAREGILFTRFYANSFRTDRGVLSVLSGYPAQPTTSLMKYPRKTQELPAIVRSLKKAGYTSSYYYGGDADFTNMRSYLLSQGIDKLVSDVDFPIGQRLSKWGAHDHLVFNRLLADLQSETRGADSRWIKIIQTSSSHEPFDVPYDRLSGVDERLNAFAYTDQCVGDFLNAFRQLPDWEHTVVWIVPDHLGAYPKDIDNFTPGRYQIPLLIVGGAVQGYRVIDTVGSQHDIAATLLAQLGLPHDEFLFSKNMLDDEAPHFAFFTVPDAFGIVTAEGKVIYDVQGGKIVYEEGSGGKQLLKAGKAYLQCLYDDMANR